MCDTTPPTTFCAFPYDPYESSDESTVEEEDDERTVCVQPELWEQTQLETQAEEEETLGETQNE
jgi:hypothetical protein